MLVSRNDIEDIVVNISDITTFSVEGTMIHFRKGQSTLKKEL